VIHSRIILGTTWQSVSLTTLEGITSGIPPVPALDVIAPSAPTGLVGTALSSSQIKLTWDPSTDNVAVTGYDVYLNDAPLATTTATTFTHSGLTAATTYNYRVSAHDAVPNYSTWIATPVSVTTLPAAPAPDTQAPSVPAGLVGTALSSSQIKLTWNPSTDNVAVTGYSVYLNDVALTTTTTTSFTHSGLAAGTTYNYRVSAYDAVPNQSARSATQVSVTTPAAPPAPPAPDTQAPSVPTGLVGTALSSSQIKLTWNPSTDNVGVTGYTVYLNDVALTTTTATSFTHSGLAAGTTYNYRVSAYDAVPNHSAWSATQVSVKTPARRAVNGDFNGDGKSDILWRNSASGQTTTWLMAGATISTNGLIDTVADLNWRIVGVGDFNGDGKSDILWRNRATGEYAFWFMNGATILNRSVVGAVADLNWSIAGVGDFDGDGKSDILWHNSATGSNTIWLMNGNTISGGAADFAAMTDLNWNIAGVGDYDGDGKFDILWRNRVTGENTIWLMNGATILSQPVFATVSDLSWRPSGAQ
jgi:chitodextrinase